MSPWRERALNAEVELRRSHNEIDAQRRTIGQLLGRIADLEADLPADGVRQLLAENHQLKVDARTLTQRNLQLENALASSRDNNRFLDKRIADLEMQVLQGRST